MKTEKIDLREVKVFDLMDQQILLPTPFQKDLGNKMYTGSNSVEMADLGRKIFYAARDEKDLILNQDELRLLTETFDFFPLLGKPLHDGIKDYLIMKLELLNQNTDGNDTSN